MPGFWVEDDLEGGGTRSCGAGAQDHQCIIEEHWVQNSQLGEVALVRCFGDEVMAVTAD